MNGAATTETTVSSDMTETTVVLVHGAFANASSWDSRGPSRS
jgi:hypothetical protein